MIGLPDLARHLDALLLKMWNLYDLREMTHVTRTPICHGAFRVCHIRAALLRFEFNLAMVTSLFL